LKKYDRLIFVLIIIFTLSGCSYFGFGKKEDSIKFSDTKDENQKLSDTNLYQDEDKISFDKFWNYVKQKGQEWANDDFYVVEISGGGVAEINTNPALRENQKLLAQNGISPFWKAKIIKVDEMWQDNNKNALGNIYQETRCIGETMEIGFVGKEASQLETNFVTNKPGINVLNTLNKYANGSEGTGIRCISMHDVVIQPGYAESMSTKVSPHIFDSYDYKMVHNFGSIDDINLCNPACWELVLNEYEDKFIKNILTSFFNIKNGYHVIPPQ